MARNAGKIAGSEAVHNLQQEGILGAAVEADEKPDLSTFPTAWRQQLIFQEMKRIALVYMRAWFPG
jgi:hypothetical protein